MLYRNTHYRNDCYDSAKIQIKLSLEQKQMSLFILDISIFLFLAFNLVNYSFSTELSSTSTDGSKPDDSSKVGVLCCP